jgi:hypothetical protein
MDFIRPLVFALGAFFIAGTFTSAVQTFVLPRSSVDLLTRLVFMGIRKLFDVRLRWARTYAERDAIMALYAPSSLMALPPAWLMLVWLGYAAMFWAVGVEPARHALEMSGSSLLTLGYVPPQGWMQMALVYSEATIGLVLIALLIAYLPTMYSAFARREATVALLEVRAGSPPSAVEMFARYQRIHTLAKLHDVWEAWETWFVETDESHTSLAALAFFRSPQPDRSWVTAAGAVLDAAALALSTVDTPYDPQAALCIRAGYLALRRIADVFAVQYDGQPRPGDPISITRDEFDTACDQLVAQSVPLKPDREQAWRDFAGWRVNYDTVLLALAAITMAPYAPWSSDRSLLRRRKMLT